MKKVLANSAGLRWLKGGGGVVKKLGGVDPIPCRGDTLRGVVVTAAAAVVVVVGRAVAVGVPAEDTEEAAACSNLHTKSLTMGASENKVKKNHNFSIDLK